MTRILATLSSAALLTMAAQAQCFEPNFGTNLGGGDDVLLASQPLNINFPMGGAVPVATHVRINTNGCAFLWSAATGELNTTATGYSTLAATMVTNLRGTAGGAPRIAPFWRDLNMIVANGAGVYLNNTIPGKAVITWDKAIAWNTAQTPFTFQVQLIEATGEIFFFYGPNTQNVNVTPLAGVSVGGAIADPGVSDFAVPSVGVSTSKIRYETWATANTFDLAAQTLHFIPNGGGGYDSVAAPCVPASNVNYGTGCYDIASSTETFYQFFADAAVASAALQGNAMVFTRNGNAGYTGTWVPGGAAGLYVAPTGGATSLPVSDDGDTVVTIPGVLPVPGGTATTLTVSHNGVITVGGVGNNSGDYNITGPEVAAATGRAFYSFSDFRDNNTTPLPSGTIKTELVGSSFDVTWDGVDHWMGTQVNNPSTFQFRFNLLTGDVTLSWVTIDTDTTSPFGSSYLVGYTGPGAGTDPGSITLSTASPVTATDNIKAMTLSAAPTPVINPSTVVTYTLKNIPEFVPGSGLYLSTMFLSVNPNPGGFDLLGILTNTVPGCNAWILTLDLDLGGQLTFAPQASWNFTYDNVNFAPGNAIAAQGVALFDSTFPLLNGESGGFLTSNGVLSTAQPQ